MADNKEYLIQGHLELSEDLFPNTAIATQTVLSLPMHPYLDEETVDTICKSII